MIAILAGAAAVLGGLAGWHLAVRRWPYALSAGLWWSGLRWWRKAALAAVSVLGGAMAGLAWELSPAAAVLAAVVLAGSEAAARLVRAAVARREEHS